MLVILGCGIVFVIVGHKAAIRLGWVNPNSYEEKYLFSILSLVVGMFLGFLLSTFALSLVEYKQTETYSGNLLPLPNSGKYLDVYQYGNGDGYVIYQVEDSDGSRFESIDFTATNHRWNDPVTDVAKITKYTSSPSDPFYWLYAFPFSGSYSVTVFSVPDGGIGITEISRDTS